jgi:uncharacterized RDD family membrane protein YckC
LDWQRAGFWRRFVAALIDGILLGVVGFVLALILGDDVLIAITLGGAEGPGLLLSAAYFTFFHGRNGQTPGNAALGLRVVDLRDGTGGPLGYGRAAMRWLVSIASALVIFVGYLWMLWDDEKQTWHDKAAGSIVVREPS